MKLFFQFICLFIASTSFGQSYRVEEIEQVNPFDSTEYIFPKIVVPENSVVTKKINDILRIDFLEATTETPENHIFDSIWAIKDRFWSLNYIDYKIEPNTNSIVSLSISGERCYAYCEENTIDYTFDVKTGERLALDELFIKTGLTLLIDSINISKIKLITEKLLEIKDTITHEKFVDEENYYKDMFEMYSECLENKIQLEYIHGFLISGNKITITTDRCSSHVNRNIDELWDFKFTFNLEDWNNFLTTYGKTLIVK
jgi:hypothetical protein